MKTVIIGASEESLHTIEKAKKHGLTVTALDGNPKAAGLEAADIGKVVNISQEDITIQAVKEEQVDFVLTVPIGRYLTTIGAVNDVLNLPGIGKESACFCTDKLRFHQKMAEYHLRNCECYEVTEEMEERQQLLEQIKENKTPLEFPAILKPRYGSGSRGIYFVTNLDELENGLRDTSGEDYILEECMEGEEYGVDGAVIQGRFSMILLRKKENTPPPARQAVAYFSVLPEDRFYQQIKEYLEKTVKALKLTECLFHADIMQTKEGPFAIELSARPSGHNLHNLFTPLCTGVDMAEEYIKYRIGKEYNFCPVTTKQMMIHYFDMEGKVEWVPDKSYVEEILGITFLAWKCNIREGDMLESVSNGHSLMGRGYFVLEGNSETELKKQAKEIKNLFQLSKKK